VLTAGTFILARAIKGEDMPETEVPKNEIDETTDENEATDSDEEFEEDSKEVADESVKDLFADQGTQVAEARRQLTRTVEMVNLASDTAVTQDTRDSTYKDGSEKGDVKNKDAGPRIKAQKDSAREYRENNVGAQKRKGRLFARVKGINLFLTLVSTVSTAITLIVALRSSANAANGEDDGELAQLTDEQRQQLKEQIHRWWELSDADVWEAMAKYCDRWNPSWQAQMLMMDEIKDLSRKL
jgi:hypothetical protein